VEHPLKTELLVKYARDGVIDIITEQAKAVAKS
jgi:hypothetical protein